MAQYAVLTAMGNDRPGLVEAVSKYILDCGCNIEDSRMAILGGEFAMIMLVTGGETPMSKLLKAPQAKDLASLNVQVKPTRAPNEAAKPGAIPYIIEAFAMDHPGIVQTVASFLAQNGINIRALETRLQHAPITGLPLFSLHATIEMPAQKNVVEIRRGLEQIAATQNIDIVVKPAGR